MPSPRLTSRRSSAVPTSAHPQPYLELEYSPPADTPPPATSDYWNTPPVATACGQTASPRSPSQSPTASASPHMPRGTDIARPCFRRRQLLDSLLSSDQSHAASAISPHTHARGRMSSRRTASAVCRASSLGYRRDRYQRDYTHP